MTEDEDIDEMTITPEQAKKVIQERVVRMLKDHQCQIAALVLFGEATKQPKDRIAVLAAVGNEVERMIEAIRSIGEATRSEESTVE
jgi:hypothetical protein